MAHDEAEEAVEDFRRIFIPAAIATLQAQGHVPAGLGVDAAMAWLAEHQPDAADWIGRRIADVRMMALTARFAGKPTPAFPEEYNPPVGNDNYG